MSEIDQLLQQGEQALQGARLYVERLQARKAHRERAGRKLSRADLEQARLVGAALADVRDVTSQLLGHPKAARLAAVRRRLRDVDLLDL